MNHIKTSLALAIGTFLAVSCVNREDQQTAVNQAIPVKVLQIEPYSANQPVIYTGIAEASQSIPLSFLTSGTIDQVFFNEGDNIRKGQLAASLNSISYQNAFNMAEAKEKQAKDAYDRLSAVYKNGSLPEVKMVEMETNLQQAESAMQIAKKNLDDCRLYSPVDGLIGKKSIDPGMNILSGITAFTVVKIDKMFVKISIPENEIASVKKGETATFSVPALNNMPFTGKIEQKGVVANPLSHTYEIKLGVNNIHQQLMPGMLCNVTMANQGANGLIIIPQQIVQRDAKGKSFVFMVDSTNHTAIRKVIQTGKLMDNGLIEVLSGLTQHDRVITEGYQKINDQSPVQIMQ